MIKLFWFNLPMSDLIKFNKQENNLIKKQLNF